MATFRSKETEERYALFKETTLFATTCPLCNEHSVIQKFSYWNIVPNAFPYDQVATVHDMVVLNRHAPDAEVTEEEWREFQIIKNGYAQEHYDFMIEPMKHNKSIPTHAHFHFLVEKKEKTA